MGIHKKAWHSVICDKHGMERYKGGPNEYYCSTPKTKKQRVSGCPVCKKLAKAD